jgi:hypothetical protein
MYICITKANNMSAFYKFQEPNLNGETLSHYKARILLQHQDITILNEVELKNLTRLEIAELNSINYANYIQLFGKFEDEYKAVKIGDEIMVGIFDIEPRDMCNKYWIPSEWDLATVNGSFSSDLIQVSKKLIIQDGHNRLKAAIASGKEYIKVKIVK